MWLLSSRVLLFFGCIRCVLHCGCPVPECCRCWLHCSVMHCSCFVPECCCFWWHLLQHALWLLFPSRAGLVAFVASCVVAALFPGVAVFYCVCCAARCCCFRLHCCFVHCSRSIPSVAILVAFVVSCVVAALFPSVAFWLHLSHHALQLLVPGCCRFGCVYRVVRCGCLVPVCCCGRLHLLHRAL